MRPPKANRSRAKLVLASPRGMTCPHHSQRRAPLWYGEPHSTQWRVAWFDMAIAPFRQGGMTPSHKSPYTPREPQGGAEVAPPMPKRPKPTLGRICKLTCGKSEQILYNNGGRCQPSLFALSDRLSGHRRKRGWALRRPASVMDALMDATPSPCSSPSGVRRSLLGVQSLSRYERRSSWLASRRGFGLTVAILQERLRLRYQLSLCKGCR